MDRSSDGSNARVLTRSDNGVLTITLNRPDALNSLDKQTHCELSAAFDWFDQDDALTVAVITGSGQRAFCAGSDLKMLDTGNIDVPYAGGYAGLLERFDLVKPVIAAINGDAIGGGFEIVTACDLAIAVRGARFGLPEPRVGLAASGGLHRLARSLPMKHAMQIALGAELFSADEALAFGLVNEVVDDDALWLAVNRTVNRLQASSPLALQATKQMLLQGLDAGGLRDACAVEYPAYRTMLNSDDAKEGVQAFTEKRSPVWRGA